MSQTKYDVRSYLHVPPVKYLHHTTYTKVTRCILPCDTHLVVMICVTSHTPRLPAICCLVAPGVASKLRAVNTVVSRLGMERVRLTLVLHQLHQSSLAWHLCEGS